MGIINSIKEIPDQIREYRDHLQYGDKTLKVSSYLGLLILHCSAKGRVGHFATIASQVNRFRVIPWMAFGIQDTCDFVVLVRGGKKSVNKNKLYSLGLLITVSFEWSYVGSAILRFVPAADLARRVAAPAPYLIIALDSVGLIDTFTKKKRERGDEFSVADSICDIGCTGLEIADRSGVLSASLGAASGAANMISRRLKNSQKP